MNNTRKKKIKELINLSKEELINLIYNIENRLVEVIKEKDNDINELKQIIIKQEERIQHLEYIIEQQNIDKYGKKKGGKRKEKKETNPLIDNSINKGKRTKESYRRDTPKESEVNKHKKCVADKCIFCNGDNIEEISYSYFYKEDIPIIKKIITKYKVYRYRSNCCNKEFNAIKVPSAKVVLGDNLKKEIIYSYIELKLTYSSIVKTINNKYNIKISEGEIVNILDKYSNILIDTKLDILKTIRNNNLIHIDETSWKVKNNNRYMWVLSNSNNVVYEFGVKRNMDVLYSLLGDSNSNIVTDDYCAYSRLVNHQLCLVHPFRKFRSFAKSNVYICNEEVYIYLNYVFDKFKYLYKEIKEVLDKDFNKKYYNRKRLIIKNKFIELLKDNKLDPKGFRVIKKSFIKNIDKHLYCLTKPNIPAHNNHAERDIRHLVIKRKISFGSNSIKGCKILSVLYSVYDTLKKQYPNSYYTEFMKLLDRKCSSPYF